MIEEQKHEQADLNFLSHDGLDLGAIIKGEGKELHGPDRLRMLRQAKKEIMRNGSLASNSYDKGQISTLTYLVLNGFSFLVRDFLLNNPNVDLGFTDKRFGITALHWATIIGNYTVARELIECIRMKGQTALLDNHTNFYQTTPLMTATYRGHLDITRLLLEAGADLQARDREGRTALDWAKIGKKPETVAFLEDFQRLGTPTKSSSSPAQDSKEAPKTKLLTQQQSFLKFGSVNPKSTPEEQATWQEEQEALYREKVTAEKLIDAIKDGHNSTLKQIFDVTKKAKDTLDNKNVHKDEKAILAATQALKEIKGIISYVDDRGRMLNKGRTAWNHAVRENNVEAMILLIQYGADINRQTKAYGDTALHLAAYDNNAEVIETLFSPVIQTQLKKGMYLEIDKLNHDGDTALAMAACWGNLEATIALLAAGANCHTQNNKGKTPLAIAEQATKDQTLRAKRAEVAKCIREFQAEQTKEFPIAAARIGYSLADIWEGVDEGLLPTNIIIEQVAGQLIPTSFINKVNEERSKKLMALISRPKIIDTTEKYGDDRWENIQEVKKRLDRGIDPNFKDEHGGNVLIYLIMNGYLSLTRQVLQIAPNLIGLQDTQYKSNALHWAAYQGNPGIMRVLLETLRRTKQLSLFINVKTHLGLTPLMEAIYRGNLEAAKLLIAAGADFEAFLEPSSSPAPPQLERVKDQEGLNQLRALCVSLNKVDDAPQKRALIHGMFTDIIPDHAKHLFQEESSRQRFEEQCRERNSQEFANALKDGDTEEVARLTAVLKSVKKDKDVKETKEATPPAPSLELDPHYRDHTGLTLLHLAAIAGDDKLVFNLVTKHKVDINAQSPNGNTALHLAALHNRITVIETLLKDGASLTITNRNGQTPLALAKEAEQIRAAHFIEHFKKPEKTAKPADAKSDQEDLSFDERQALRLLNIKLVTVTEATPTLSLLEAAEAGDGKIVREILRTNTSALEEVDDDQYTPLHLAAKNGHTNVVNILLEHKANIEAKGADGRTPLACAVAGGHLDTTQKLIRRGANIDVTGNKGETLAQLATGPVKKFYEDETRVILLRSRYLADQLALTEDIRLTHHAELKNDQFTSLVLKKLASANESKKSKVIAGLIKDLKDEKPKSIKETLTRLYGFCAAFGEKDGVAATMAESIAASRTEAPKPEESFLAGVARVFQRAPAILPKSESVAELSNSQIIVDTTGNSIN